MPWSRNVVMDGEGDHAGDDLLDRVETERPDQSSLNSKI